MMLSAGREENKEAIVDMEFHDTRVGTLIVVTLL